MNGLDTERLFKYTNIEFHLLVYMITALLFLALQVQPSPHQIEPLKINQAQASFLKAEAKKVRKNLKNTRKKLDALDRGLRRPWWCALFPFSWRCFIPYDSPIISNNFYSVANKNELQMGVTRAIANVEDARRKLLAVPGSNEQREAIDGMLEGISADYRSFQPNAQGVSEPSYPGVRAELEDLIEQNAEAYEVTADTMIAAIPIVVSSIPVTGARIEFKRAEQPDANFANTLKITNNYIGPLERRPWAIRCILEGYEEYREKVNARLITEPVAVMTCKLTKLSMNQKKQE